MPGKVRPKARSQRLIVRRLESETLVYDLERSVAHCLSPVAAAVWSECDGTRTVEELAELDVEALAGSDARQREPLVRLALSELDQVHLLDKEAGAWPPPVDFSRRQVVQQLGGAAALPLVASLIQPAPAGGDLSNPPPPPGPAPQGERSRGRSRRR